MADKYWDRPKKNITRQLAEPNRKVKKTLWLPGEDALDILNAWNKKKIDNKGKHILVEKSKLVIPKIKDNIKNIPIDFEIYQGDLHSMKKPDILDYSHLDFCGGLDSLTAKWINQLNFEPGASIHFTFAYAPRCNLFINKCHEIFKNDSECKKVLVREYTVLERKDINIAVYCALLRCVLRNYEFAALQPVYYKDAVQSMVLYRCEGLGKVSKPKYPNLMDKFGDFSGMSLTKPEATMLTTTERKKVAAKAVKTRKANERKLFLKRSKAAQKAWETRRKNSK